MEKVDGDFFILPDKTVPLVEPSLALKEWIKMKFLNSLKNKKLSKEVCLLRVDFNVENEDLERWQKNHKNTPFRIQAVLPTIKFLVNRGARVVILSHRGRPKPAKLVNYKKFSLKPFAKIISKLVKRPVQFIDFNLGTSDVQKLTSILRTSDVLKIFLLENLRFFDGEEKNDSAFAKKLASLGTFYVNDAFAVSHRKNASVAAITKYLPSYAGLRFEKEIKNLKIVMKKPKKSLAIIIGGAKISDKLGLIKNFSTGADYFLLGGGIANTFMAALGTPMKGSLYEEEMIPEAKKILKTMPKKIFLPIDFLINKNRFLDIGPKTINFYNKKIQAAKTIIWNGPMGKFEDRRFAKGTEKIAKTIFKNKKAKTVIGGGETIASLPLKPNVFLSTGGGAMLEFLAGKKLPGIEALRNKK